MADTPKHSVSVAGIVVDDQKRVLVIQRRDNGHWEPPGGVLELDERIEDGVAREVREETGIEVAVEQLTGVYKNLSRGVVALVFRCRKLAGVEATSTESRMIAWMSLAEIEGAMDAAYSVRVTDALRNSNVAVRAHDGVRVLSA